MLVRGQGADGAPGEVEEALVTILMAILLPPIAFFMVGKPIQGVISLLLCVTVLGWIPAAIWAVLVVNSAHADRRHQELLEAQRGKVS
ncbi:Proteolipid membrane potential modulator [uncultured Caudovirales phage]|uniref:Proteolipid membrane potential modulator n=1 Tax=uncultured Caudovirales phage TaxID=2100421 RepID=A0A6J5Q6F7_9CAUD|nr:Proteolipid membrane potential modulator [uncultured Caudovirales phage]CAB4173044.1 Proteolipid membrane potential modulator [uncultured Caudovirales phage]CAB4179643.1 Proteolipid membrane potential modulator [uncultured Caudovirales phage]CAB4204279.1 Proteolipid membrane potential modulator [uncultured Caudovirales phage]CAB4215793.1 Proteolipid membrane potential modulator [uncultured Caudovirales phage]